MRKKYNFRIPNRECYLSLRPPIPMVYEVERKFPVCQIAVSVIEKKEQEGGGYNSNLHSTPISRQTLWNFAHAFGVACILFSQIFQRCINISCQKF